MIGVLAAGCDSGPGPADFSGRNPVVQELAFTPDTVFSDGPGETVQVSLSVEVDASDADGDLDRVYFIVQSPVPGADAAGRAEIDAPDDGRFSADMTLTLPRGAAGTFPVVAFASDAGGHMSNRAIGTLVVQSGSEPPVITEVDLQERVTRPAPGESPIPITITARVQDPDGLGNVLRVEAIVGGSTTLLLCDDGGTGTCNPGFGSSGDATAGDGTFTVTIQIESSNTAGDYQFVFTAYDRSGLASEAVTRIITVE
jgi:hypothetical protein